MAVVAQGYAGVLAMLFNVVGATGWGSVANTTGQAFNPRQVFALGCIKLIIHIVTLSKNRAEAS